MRLPSRLKPFRSIDDLDIDLRLTRISQPPIDLRQQAPIMVIDDQPFAPQNNLEANGFSLTVLSEINSVKKVEPYALILCDLMGVDAALHEELQGAHVIREIKKNYPEKVVFAYTGGSTESRVTREAIASADYYLRKDVDIAEWCEKLDHAISDLASPVIVWKVFRLRLLESGITPIQLAEMEDVFVRSYGSGYDIARARFQALADKSNITNNARSVISSFISSVIFGLIFA